MVSNKTTILLIGATGYIGGTVLSKLLEHPKFSSFEVTAIVRSPEKAKKLEQLNVRAVVGSFDDEELLVNLAAESEVVIAAADADNLGVALAILKGMKIRFQRTGKLGTLIHTASSGTGVLTDDAKGMYPTDNVYDDMNPGQIESLPPTQVHRNVDLAILDADREGYVRAFFVLPSTIYGLASGRLVDMGIQHRQSIQIPLVIRTSLARKQGGMPGAGKNIWPNVHIDDVADIYIKVLDAVLEGKNPGHGREGFHFGENGEHTLYDVCKRISEILVERGLGQSLDPTPFTEAEIAEYMGGTDYLGTNCRCRANRARTLGWNPKRTTKDLIESLPAEVDATIAA